jgi:hypothetical protein
VEAAARTAPRGILNLRKSPRPAFGVRTNLDVNLRVMGHDLLRGGIQLSHNGPSGFDMPAVKLERSFVLGVASVQGRLRIRIGAYEFGLELGR